MQSNTQTNHPVLPGGTGGDAVNPAANPTDQASRLLSQRRLLFDYGRLIQRLGVVREDKNIRLLLLALTSRLLPTGPISLILKGDSSAGKSFLLKQCLKVMPPETCYEYTSMSDRALFYTDRDFRHRFIIFYEFTGQSDSLNYLLRSLITEGKLKYETTVRDKHRFLTRLVEKPGPTGFISTTTAGLLDHENEARVFSIYLDESAGQTEAVLRSTAQRYWHPGGYPTEAEIRLWQHLQELLQPLPVFIPFAHQLVPFFPAGDLRLRRDFSRLLDLIAACALLHQYQRPPLTRNGLTGIQASILDYLMVREIFTGLRGPSFDHLSPRTIMLINAVAAAYLEKARPASSQGVPAVTPISFPELVQKTALAPRTAQRWVSQTVEQGYLERRKIGSYTYYLPTFLGLTVYKHTRTDAGSSLPSLRHLVQSSGHRPDNESFVHPLTGELLWLHQLLQ